MTVNAHPIQTYVSCAPIVHHFENHDAEVEICLIDGGIDVESLNMKRRMDIIFESCEEHVDVATRYWGAVAA